VDEKTESGSVWAEHTVVANLPRLFPGVAAAHAPLCQVEEPRTLLGMPPPPPPAPPTPGPEPQPKPELVSVALGRPLAEVEEPRTVVAEAPSLKTARQLIERYAALASAAPVASDPPSMAVVPAPWFRRVTRFAKEDFARAPRIVRLLLPALPLIAAATTFLDVDPRAPALSAAVAVAATTAPDVAEPVLPPQPVVALPSSSVTVVRHPGRTLAADAADAAARGDRSQAIAAYAQLARENPGSSVYASAARILARDKARDRPSADP
jgi:hypothetical protein